MVARKPLFLAALLVSAALATTTVGQAATHRDSIAPAASSTTVVKAQAARSTHHFRGNVVSRNRSRRWFRMHTTTRRSLRIYTNQRTSWGEDCDWGDMRYVDVRAYRSHGRWMASRMQNWDNGDWGDWGDGDWD